MVSRDGNGLRAIDSRLSDCPLRGYRRDRYWNDADVGEVGCRIREGQSGLTWCNFRDLTLSVQIGEWRTAVGDLWVGHKVRYYCGSWTVSGMRVWGESGYGQTVGTILYNIDGSEDGIENMILYWLLLEDVLRRYL